MLSSTEYLNLSGLRVELEHINVGITSKSESNNDLQNVKIYLENRIHYLEEQLDQ